MAHSSKKLNKYIRIAYIKLSRSSGWNKTKLSKNNPIKHYNWKKQYKVTIGYNRKALVEMYCVMYCENVSFNRWAYVHVHNITLLFSLLIVLNNTFSPLPLSSNTYMFAWIHEGSYWQRIPYFKRLLWVQSVLEWPSLQTWDYKRWIYILYTIWWLRDKTGGKEMYIWS